MAKSDKKISRKERETKRQRFEIIEAAERIFAKKGYHNTSMNDIAKESEFSVGFLYKIFASKEELYSSLMIQKMNELDHAIDIQLERASNPYEQIEIIIDAVISHLKENRDFFKIYINEADGFEWNIENKFGKHIAEQFDKFIRDTVEIIKDGIVKGFFVDLDPTTLAVSFVGMLNGYCSYWTKNSKAMDLRRGAEVLKKIFLGKITLQRS